MIKIKVAKESDVQVLALLGRITYSESHGHFIEDKNDLISYLTGAFSVEQTTKDVLDSNNLVYIIYYDDLPVGYAKMVLNANHESVISKNSGLLERIYLLNDFIPMKIGQQFLTFIEQKAKEIQLDTIWLSVYIKNERAIRFYEKNEYRKVGELNFLVSGKEYENFVFSKKIDK